VYDYAYISRRVTISSLNCYQKNYHYKNDYETLDGCTRYVRWHYKVKHAKDTKYLRFRFVLFLLNFRKVCASNTQRNTAHITILTFFSCMKNSAYLPHPLPG
jgi:hypothetical protein